MFTRRRRGAESLATTVGWSDGHAGDDSERANHDFDEHHSVRLSARRSSGKEVLL